MSALKAVVIGCGRMGAFTSEKTRSSIPRAWLPLSHAEAIHSISGIELVGVCDVDRSAADAAAKEYGTVAFVDYKEMLQKLKPDIVTVATRTDVRAQIIREAVANGAKAIHAEKPLCRSLAESLDVIEILRSHRIAFSYGTVRRYMEAFKRAKEIVSSGEIGKLRQIILRFGHSHLMWSAPHLFDLLVFFSDGAGVEYVQASMRITDVAEDSAHMIKIDSDPRIDFATVMFESGVSGIITSAGGMKTELACEGGTIVVGDDGPYIEVQKDIGVGYFAPSVRMTPKSLQSGTQAAIAGLRDAIVEGARLGITLDELEKEQRILFALVISALRDGARVELDTVSTDIEITGRMGDLYA